MNVKNNALRFAFVVLALLGCLHGTGLSQTSSDGATASYSISLTPAPLTFGQVSVGSSSARSETLFNPGGRKVILTAATVTGAGLSIRYHPTFPYTLSAGTGIALRLKFAPLAAGYITGSMTVHYRYLLNKNWVKTSSTVHISGTGTTASGSLTASPSSLNFGTVQVSAAKTVSETLTNSGTTALTISQITPSGAAYGFSGINPPVTLSSGQSASFLVTFAPATSGSLSGNLTIDSNASNPTLSLPLSGTGTAIGQLSVSPSSANFGNVVVGTKSNQTATVTASNGAVTVSAASSSGAEFSLSGLSFPFTLNAGQSASGSLVFAPTASGITSATVTWVSNASNSPPTQSLTGTGMPPPSHSVTLSWKASTASNVIGYNIYRATTSTGPYVQTNTALDPTTQDIDYNVLAGKTYYYVVAAVNSTGVESVYSNQVKALIPYP